MSKNEKIDVAHIANLARLELSDDMIEKLQGDMEAIVEYVEQLQELDIEGIEPTAHGSPLTNIWREDICKESFDREVMLKNAPATVDDELLRVPQVLPSEGGA